MRKVKTKINGVRCRGCVFCRNEVDHASLGHDLRAEREKSGLAQAEVARAMNTASQFISDLERGRRNWTADLVGRYMSAIRGKEPA